MNPLEKLHDIEGIDAISRWPLSFASFVVIAIGVLILSIAIYWAISFFLFKRSWKNDTLKKLSILEKNLCDETSRETVVLLSEYLRRIALRRFSRKECAGISGRAWLKWLAMRDPKQFDWEKKGTLLIEVPYSPISSVIPTPPIKDLIQAIRDWVR